LDLANQEFEGTAEQYRRLARKSINQDDLRKYVKRVLKVEDEQNASTRLKNIAEAIARLAETGRGNELPSIRGTYILPGKSSRASSTATDISTWPRPTPTKTPCRSCWDAGMAHSKLH
jgi:Domain of unknown function (DUF932)